LGFFLGRIKDRVARWAKDDSTVDDSDLIFSLSSSYITLDTKIGLVTTGRCALAVEGNSGQFFDEMEQEVGRFLHTVEQELDLSHDMVTDSRGCLWVVLYAKKIEDLLAGLTAVGDTVKSRGFSGQMQAAVFEFYNSGNNENCFLVYDYKRNRFYPFVPVSHKRRRRDAEEEKRIVEVMSDEMPFEKDRDLWRPLWNLPL
jgi:hypothetical protein